MDARDDSDFAPAPDKGRSRPWHFRPHEFLIVFAIIGVLVVLLLPFRRSAGDAARRAQCTNNLKLIGLALDSYVNAHGCLPPAATVDAQGRVLHSWRTLILPHIENNLVYRSIDLSKPWNDPTNAQALASPPSYYHCPSSPDPSNTTTYLASAGADACLAAHAGRPLAEFRDGTASTLAVIEAGPADAVPWMQPTDADAALLARFAASKVHKPGGANALFADGSVRFLKGKTPAPTLRALRTIAGGESPSADSF